MYINSHFKELKVGQSLLMEATDVHFIFHLIVLLTSSYLFINSKLQINEAWDCQLFSPVYIVLEPRLQSLPEKSDQNAHIHISHPILKVSPS